MKRTFIPIDLSAFNAFEGVEADAILELERRATRYTLKHRELLYPQGELAHSVYFVESGGIKLVQVSPDGQQVTLKIFGAGDLSGLLAISGPFPHPSSAEAIGDTMVIGISGGDLREVIRDYPKFGLRVIDLLVDHVHAAHGRLRTMMIERADQRLARALMHYCEKFGVETADGISIDVTLSQQDLAQFCGITLETVNRTLKVWQDQDLIRLSRQHIDVLDCMALKGIIEDRTPAMS